MAEARINDSCIIGLPTYGYAFSSSRMAFIAAPSDDEFRLELDILQSLLADKNYEAYVAVQRVDPAKLALAKLGTPTYFVVIGKPEGSGS